MMFLYPALIGVVVATTIPIRFNEHNQPIIPNCLVPGLVRQNTSSSTISQFDAILSMQSPVGTVMCGTDDRFEGSLLDSILLPDRSVLIPSNHLQIRDMSGRRSPVNGNPYDTIVSIGIASRSYLMDQFETMSILRNSSSNTGLLILNDSDASAFNRSCVPDTIGHIPYTTDSGADQRVDVEYRLLYPAGESAPAREVTETPPSGTYLYSGKILSLPNAMALGIYDTISESGAYRARGSDIVENCNFESLSDQLPNIILSFTRSTATIVLYPEDYMAYKPESNECHLRFERQEWDFEITYINPLVLPSTNLHLTGNGIFICDAQ